MKRRNRRSAGFTLAELLVVVAIVVVLSGVGFVAVVNYQRSMTQLERDAVAKEIFVAAQNHLTMAEGQGYLKTEVESAFYGAAGTASADEAGKKIHYFVVNNGTAGDSTLFDLMLPFGSIDEIVRSGGSYIIRYQPNPATVLDVFYCSTDSRFGHTVSETDYVSFVDDMRDVDSENHKSDRRKLSDGGVLGWYGGATALESGAHIESPTIEVENSHKLIVRVTDQNAISNDKPDHKGDKIDASLKLIITGASSGTQAAITIKGTSVSTRVSGPVENVYAVTLDDITTAGKHFADMNTETGGIEFNNEKGLTSKRFIPGENITVTAVAYSSEKLTNIAYSKEATTNSLFADISQKTPAEIIAALNNPSAATPADATKPWVTAMIGSIRHLENLDASISHLDANDTGAFNITNASQIDDLIWSGTADADSDEIKSKDFIRNTKGDASSVSIYKMDGTTHSADNTFIPVNPSHYGESANTPVALAYDGQVVIEPEDTSTPPDPTAPVPAPANHTITGIVVSANTDAGLFQSLAATSSVQNLELIDFSITTTAGNAGALAGSLGAGSTVSNVLARNSEACKDKTYEETPRISSTGSGSAGGLIGSIEAGSAASSISKSAAAMYVSATGNAGGLVGSAAGVTIADSYTGGHTKEGVYSKATPNVTAGTNQSAGGLIGSASGTVTINYCYSTCSTQASGTAASGEGAGATPAVMANAGGLIGKTEGEAVSAHYVYAIGPATGSNVNKGTLVGSGVVKDSSVAVIDADDLKYAYTVDIDIDDLNDVANSGIDGTETVSGVTSYKTVKLADAYPYDTTGHTSEVREIAPAVGETPAQTETVYLYDYLNVVQLHKLEAKNDATVTFTDDSLIPYPAFTQAHYGDWEKVKLVIDTDLTLTNADVLTADVKVPTAQIGEGKLITMLVHGDTSGDATESYLVFKVTPDPAASTEYVIALSEKTVIPGITTDTSGNPLTGDALTNALTAWATAANIRPELNGDNLDIKLDFDNITHCDSDGKGDGHFTQLFPKMIPGEDLSVMAKGGSKSQEEMRTALIGDGTPAGRAAAETENWTYETDQGGTKETWHLGARTNSLFADPQKTVTPESGTPSYTVPGSDVANGVAGISSIRHLENLDARISGLERNDPDNNKPNVTQANQISDLVWNGTSGDSFVEKTGNGSPINIYTMDGEKANPVEKADSTKNNSYIPVSPSVYTPGTGTNPPTYTPVPLTYDARNAKKNNDDTYSSTETENHSISGVTIDTQGDAGLFGTLTAGSSVSNLELVDISVKTEDGNAGALVATLNTEGQAASVVNVSNVVVHNSDSNTSREPTIITFGVDASDVGWNAGGLIGEMKGTSGKIEKSAAALVVSSGNGDAGGLIGKAAGGTVTACHAGGHTNKGTYYEDNGTTPIFNVTATKGDAGGLIGEAGATSISQSYSTCSATGETAGGFVGTSTATASNAISHCYATGLVKGTGEVSVTTGEGSSATIVKYPKEGAFACSIGAAGAVSSCTYFEIINERADADGNYTCLTPLGQGGTNTGIVPFDAIAESGTQSYYIAKGPDDWKTALPYDEQLKTYYKDSSDDTKTKYNLETVKQLGAASVADTDFVIDHYGDWPAPETFVVNATT